MVGHRPQTRQAPEEEQACLTDGPKAGPEGGQGSHGGQGQEAQRQLGPWADTGLQAKCEALSAKLPGVNGTSTPGCRGSEECHL